MAAQAIEYKSHAKLTQLLKKKQLIDLVWRNVLDTIVQRNASDGVDFWFINKCSVLAYIGCLHWPPSWPDIIHCKIKQALQQAQVKGTLQVTVKVNLPLPVRDAVASLLNVAEDVGACKCNNSYSPSQTPSGEAMRWSGEAMQSTWYASIKDPRDILHVPGKWLIYWTWFLGDQVVARLIISG